MSPKRLKKAIKNQLLRKGMTHRQLAEQTDGLAKSNVGKFLSGSINQHVYLTTFCKLAEAAGFEVTLKRKKSDS